MLRGLADFPKVFKIDREDIEAEEDEKNQYVSKSSEVR